MCWGLQVQPQQPRPQPQPPQIGICPRYRLPTKRNSGAASPVKMVLQKSPNSRKKLTAWRFVGCNDTDGRNLAITSWGWQLFPIIHSVLYIAGGDRRISEPSTVAFFLLHHAWCFSGPTCLQGKTLSQGGREENSHISKHAACWKMIFFSFEAWSLFLSDLPWFSEYLLHFLVSTGFLPPSFRSTHLKGVLTNPRVEEEFFNASQLHKCVCEIWIPKSPKKTDLVVC